MSDPAKTTESNPYDLVDNILKQQDEVISQLDELNLEIETLIDQLAAERKAELGIVDEQSTEETTTQPLKKAA